MRRGNLTQGFLKGWSPGFFSLSQWVRLYTMTHIWSPAFQLKPEDIDRRAVDMYSFAVILWELSTGKVPFAGLSPMQVGLKVKSREEGRQ